MVILLGPPNKLPHFDVTWAKNAVRDRDVFEVAVEPLMGKYARDRMVVMGVSVAVVPSMSTVMSSGFMT